MMIPTNHRGADGKTSTTNPVFPLITRDPVGNDDLAETAHSGRNTEAAPAKDRFVMATY